MRTTAVLIAALLLLDAELLLAAELPAQETAPNDTAVWLDEFDLKAMTQRRGVPLARRAVGGGKMIMDGKTYERGIGTRSISELVLDLHGAARRFSAVVGLDDSANDRKHEGTVRFEVWVDDRQAADSGILKVGDAPKTFDVNLTGARTITLLLDDGGDTSNGDLANWADARIELASPTSKRPTPYIPPTTPMPRIASDTSTKPAIHGPLVYGATPGRPFLYRIPATGSGPLRFAAQGLPAGLRLDADTGIITGQLAAEGTSDVLLKVSSTEGNASRRLRIVAGKNKLALTPPMGWNSWNVWGTAVDDPKVRAAADWLVRSGLAAHGYDYVVIDDAWTSGRDDKGELKPNEKFPDMKALAEYIHSKGLKIGIYSSPGPETCGGFQGSYEHEAQDAATFARWGIDFLKYDWCSYDDIATDHSLAELKKPYQIMGDALATQNRDIIFSLCQYGYGDVWKWGGEVGGHLWRTTGDLLDMWANLDSVGFRQAGRERYVSAGRWNDTDMLVVGPVGWGPDLHPTRLTPDEQLLHITLWAMQAAPLFIGADLSKLDPFTIALLTNDEVLDINRDVLAKAGGRVWSKDRMEIWSRPLADGTVAVALFNRGLEPRRIEASWSDLGIKNAQPVRNVWERRDLGSFEGSYAAEVPRHGAVMLKIGRPDATAIRRSVSLRDDWMYLTRDVAEPAEWTHDGKRFHYRKTVEGGFAVVEIDSRSLKRRAPFDATKLAVALGDATKQSYQPLRLPFETFEYADENRAITVTVASERWTCGIVSYACHRAAPEAEGRPRAFDVVRDLAVPADNHPRKSPDGKWEALVNDDNIVVRAAESKDTVALSNDGTPGDFYDPATIVWSPDSTRLVAYRVRPGFRREVTRVETSPANQLQPAVRTQLYPKPGDPVDLERLVLFQVAERRRIEIDDALFPNPYQLSQPSWRADGRTFVFDYQRRGHGQARVIEVDGQTGTPKAVITEDATTFVYADRRYRHDVGDDGREIVWISERDGWRHFYLVDAATGALKQITRGPWIVRDVLKVDDTQRRIWFSASGMDAGKDPYFKHVFRVDFDGGNLTRLTTVDATHEVRFAPDMSAYVDTYSRVDLPTVSELHRADGTLIATLERGDISRLTAAGWKPPEPFVAKGRDGITDIWGLVVRPRDYNPANKYPVIENVYAGPHDSFVPKSFWPFGFHSGGDKVIGMQAQADLGFIVVQIDGMGTANRSKAFHDVAWKNLADSGFADRILWHKALAARDPAYDISRVGIYGASAGGQSALNALLFHPDFYQAAVAYAGCYDNRMDKISWNEQWLGWPVDQSYAAASGVDHAANLRGQLLLIVGEQDSNVDPASTMQVVNALIKADKDFELLVVPGGEHSVGRSTGPIAYVQRRQFEFFVRTLQSTATPREASTGR